jgi:hypothetical protein
MKKIRNILIVSILSILCINGYKEQLMDLYDTHIKIYEVKDIENNQEQFESYQSFNLRGITVNDPVSRGLRLIPLKDEFSEKTVYIIPKEGLLPVSNKKITLKVKIVPWLTSKNFITVLQEV